MASYQAERSTVAADDETLDVVHGLVRVGELMVGHWRDRDEAARYRRWEIDVPSGQVVGMVAQESGRPTDAETRGYATRVGQVLARLRFRPVRNVGPARARG